jgi:nucleoid DNA-binding protein
VDWRGFGLFGPKKIPAQKAIDPKTKKKMKIPERRGVYFKTSPYFVVELNKK